MFPKFIMLHVFGSPYNIKYGTGPLLWSVGLFLYLRPNLKFHTRHGDTFADIIASFISFLRDSS